MLYYCNLLLLKNKSDCSRFFKVVLPSLGENSLVIFEVTSLNISSFLELHQHQINELTQLFHVIFVVKLEDDSEASKHLYSSSAGQYS